MAPAVVLRGQKVMLDRDLAELYQVETRVLKQAVRRNLSRFPGDFMFQMNQEELRNWRSQIVMSKNDKIGLRHAPFCFTEQGVAMLSSVLKSSKAIEINIQIIRVFTKMRELLKDTLILKYEIEELKSKLSDQGRNIEQIFAYLDKLIQKKPNQKTRTQIGYKKGH